MHQENSIAISTWISWIDTSQRVLKSPSDVYAHYVVQFSTSCKHFPVVLPRLHLALLSAFYHRLQGTAFLFRAFSYLKSLSSCLAHEDCIYKGVAQCSTQPLTNFISHQDTRIPELQSQGSSLGCLPGSLQRGVSASALLFMFEKQLISKKPSLIHTRQHTSLSHTCTFHSTQLLPLSIHWFTIISLFM